MLKLVEYIWMDGATPTQKLRSKARIVNFTNPTLITLDEFPEWSFDGSSTYQADGQNSDLILRPVSFVKNPLKEIDSYLALCEVMDAQGNPHPSNTRARLRQILDQGAALEEPWFGFEQEYTLFQGRTPLGWPENGYPAPQGPFYCGVGADEVFGRDLVEAHTDALMAAGIMLYGTNAEVMPGQWEFQIGYRGVGSESADPLTVSDHVWYARWLLYRIGEKYNVTATLDPKPVKGDWNGAGMHTNFSTKSLRDPATGKMMIENYITQLSQKHQTHISEYGDKLAERLTGEHETCSISEFKSGNSDRGASIRVPLTVAKKGYGYLEDRRPGANADPYRVATRILQTICAID
ncbi:MAG: glutamine synthetase beta-grasp domain-containing protein [Zetaproteobacteria bacterium]|nr:glutamine synthetase beta-grasp domain-containing protein [Zetaproteobacteria bacterium]